MRFEGTGIEKYIAELGRLDSVMHENRLYRSEQWDYDRVNYDRKFELKEGVFYFRIQGYAVEGDVGSNKADIQLMAPILGKHYYPHGVEYGEGESFPASLVKQCENIIDTIKEEVKTFAINE
ncbi:YugN family protein [Peribacillus kribbensis]|uniref:YugN family protein n=1 Tax=Peribacillus kribbensis TaxID=356658 RepID=UPI0004792AE3|nr:YugN family protein [Peribacillus kribbensis]